MTVCVIPSSFTDNNDDFSGDYDNRVDSIDNNDNAFEDGGGECDGDDCVFVVAGETEEDA